MRHQYQPPVPGFVWRWVRAYIYIVVILAGVAFAAVTLDARSCFDFWCNPKAVGDGLIAALLIGTPVVWAYAALDQWLKRRRHVAVGLTTSSRRFTIQSMAGPLPPLRAERLDLVTLSAMARTFDQISREDGRTWPAVRFVEWLADEWRASAPSEKPAEREAA